MLEQEVSGLFGQHEKMKPPGTLGDDFLCQSVKYFKIVNISHQYLRHFKVVIHTLYGIKPS